MAATINRVLSEQQQQDDDDDNWIIRGRVLCRHIFTGDNGSRLLTQIIVDADGNAIELKTWREKKVFLVYKKFRQDQAVECSSSGQLKIPNRNFSLAKCEHDETHWYLDNLQQFRFKNHFHCFSNLNKFSQSSRQPASIAGILKSISDSGPYSSRGVQGRYIELMDDECRLFKILIWIPNFDYKKIHSSLSDKQSSGSIVLIPYVRDQDEQYKSRSCWLTTTYPPVLDSQCISPRIVENLQYAWRNMSIPTLADQGYISH